MINILLYLLYNIECVRSKTMNFKINVLCVLVSIISPSLEFFLSDIFSQVVSPFIEQCDQRWVPRNIIGLEEDLNSNIFGQDLAIEVILIALRGYLTKTNHKKPLVLSFHGWTGGGKTYIKDFIIKHWFTEGVKSKFVKMYFAEKDFPLNSEIHQYKMKLHKDLEETINLCPKAVFIFDEVDKYPPLVLDAIKPYLDYNSNINGYDYRQAIFILITNTGGGLITKIAFDNWERGVVREEIRLNAFDEPLRTLAFNEEGGFYRSDLIKHHLIDYIVPFLPMERSHVQSCLRALFQQSHWYCGGHTHCDGLSDQLIQSSISEIMEEITFDRKYPTYVTQGCHNLESKVETKIEEIRRHRFRKGDREKKEL